MLEEVVQPAGSAKEDAWIQSWSGREIRPWALRPSDIAIEDIAHHLAMEVRFGGAVKAFYSVAHHSLLVARIVRDEGEPPEVQLAGLLHDASEAYLKDIQSPLKGHFGGYQDVEAAVMSVVAERYELQPGFHQLQVVKRADSIALATEKRDLLVGEDPRPWQPMEAPLADCDLSAPMTWQSAEFWFLEVFRQIQAARA